MNQYFPLVLALSQKRSIINHRNRARKIPSKQQWLSDVGSGACSGNLNSKPKVL